MNTVTSVSDEQPLAENPKGSSPQGASAVPERQTPHPLPIGAKALEEAVANSLMYLETGFIECPRCGHEVETKDTDAAYTLRASLSTVPEKEPEGYLVELPHNRAIFTYNPSEYPRHKITPLYTHPSPSEDRLRVALDALEPFAEAAAVYDPEEGDGNEIAWAHDFPIGALRKAREALATLSRQTKAAPIDQDVRVALEEKDQQLERLKEAFGENGKGYLTIIDLCYTAFMKAKGTNDEDGGPTDWFTDTRPIVLRGIEKMLSRAALSLKSQEGRS